MKKFLLGLALVFGVAFVIGYMNNDVLTRFQGAASSNIQLTSSFEDVDDDKEIEVLFKEQTTQLSFTTLEAGELTDQEKIAYVRSLFHDIQVLHAQNILFREDLILVGQTLKDHVISFREQDLNLSDVDKDQIISSRDELIDYRDLILQDKGRIRVLFSELRGKYQLENIDLIINHLEEVKEILNERQVFILYVSEKIVAVDQIVLSYLNN